MQRAHGRETWSIAQTHTHVHTHMAAKSDDPRPSSLPAGRPRRGSLPKCKKKAPPRRPSHIIIGACLCSVRSERAGTGMSQRLLVGPQRSRSCTKRTMWHRQAGKAEPSIHPSITPLNTNAPMQASPSRPPSCRQAHMSLRHTFSAEDVDVCLGLLLPVRGPCMSHLLNDTPTYSRTMGGDLRKNWCRLGYTRMEPQTCKMEAEKDSKVHEMSPTAWAMGNND